MSPAAFREKLHKASYSTSEDIALIQKKINTLKDKVKRLKAIDNQKGNLRNEDIILSSGIPDICGPMLCACRDAYSQRA